MSAGNEREFIDHLQGEVRCCRNCAFYNESDSTCYVGGYTEIGDPDKELSEEDCNAWRRAKPSIFDLDLEYGEGQ